MHMSHLGFAVAHCVSQHSPSPLSSPSPPSSGSGSTGRCDSVTASTISAQSPAGSSHTACYSARRHLSNARVTVTALSVAAHLSGADGVCLYPPHTHPGHSAERVDIQHKEHIIFTQSRELPNLFQTCSSSIQFSLIILL